MCWCTLSTSDPVLGNKSDKVFSRKGGQVFSVMKVGGSLKYDSAHKRAVPSLVVGTSEQHIDRADKNSG